MAKRVEMDELLREVDIATGRPRGEFCLGFQNWVATMEPLEVWSLCARIRELESAARLRKAKLEAAINRARHASEVRDERERDLRRQLQSVCPHAEWTPYRRIGNASTLETACLVCGVAKSKLESGARVGD